MSRYEIEDSQGYAPDTGVIPALVNPPVFLVAPSALAVGSGELWMGVSSNDENYGGCVVWLSNDGTTYYELGMLKGNSTQGVLTAALPAATGTDTVNAVSIDLSMSGMIIESVDQETVDAYDSLCYVGGEFLAFRDAALTGVEAYDLTYLERGLYGSTPGASSGAAFLLLADDSIYKYRFNKNRVGGTFYFKFQAFNIYNQGFQDLADVVAYSFVVGNDGGVKALLSDLTAIPWTNITSTPNTLSGYGITNAYTTAEVDALIPSGFDWGDITGTPTTLSGYGITDAQDLLVSGTNIKTINGSSVLGAGDLTVSGGSGSETGASKVYKFYKF